MYSPQTYLKFRYYLPIQAVD